MPTSTLPSPKRRSHSWVRAYLRSAGILLIDKAPSLNQYLAMAHERRPHHARRQEASAHLDFDRGLGSGRYSRQTDGTPQCRRERAARDLTVADAGHSHLLVTA